MADPWFHVAELPAEGELARLDEDEARHARSVRRLAAGDGVVLFDGRGRRAAAVLCEVGRKGVSARVDAIAEQPRPQPALHLVSAMPKGDRLAQMLSIGTQLGMTSLTPLECRRSVARPGAAARERWPRILREACKQSRRTWVPEIHEACTPEQIFGRKDENDALILLDPAGEATAAAIAVPALEERWSDLASGRARGRSR